MAPPALDHARTARRWRLAFGAVCALALASPAALVACSDPPAPPSVDAGTPPGGLTPEQAQRVVAKVGDRTITLGDFAATLDRMDQFDRLRYQAPERRKDLLNQMIDVELLAAEAKKRGMDKEPATQESLREVLRDALLADARKSLPTPAEIPADEVKAYYDAHADDYREPERRRVSAIVLSDDKNAKDILDQAKKVASDPAAWGKLVFERSDNAPKEKLSNIPLDLAGDLGIVGPPDDQKGGNERVPEPVRAAAFKIGKVGEVFDGVVEDDHKFYIVRLSGITAGHERTLAEADRQIRVVLLQKRMGELEDKLDADLRQKYEVKIDEDALSKLTVDLPGSDSSAPLPGEKAPSPTTSAAPLLPSSNGASASSSAPAASSSASPKKKQP